MLVEGSKNKMASSSQSTSTEIESMVRGYHVYKDIWDAAEDELLDCRREPFNSYNPFAVSVIRNGTAVGHIPKKISFVPFLHHSYRMAGEKRYVRDLPQGGLEIPCVLTFTGNSPLVDKTSHLLKEVIKSEGKAEQNIKQTSDSNPPSKVDDVGEWIKVGQESLKMSERRLVRQ